MKLKFSLLRARSVRAEIEDFNCVKKIVGKGKLAMAMISGKMDAGLAQKVDRSAFIIFMQTGYML